MNEKAVNFMLMLVLGLGVFFLMTRCNQNTTTDKKLTAPLVAPTQPKPQDKPTSVVLGSATDPKYKLALTVSTDMAGLAQVQLNVHDYAQKPDRKEPLTLFSAENLPLKPFSVQNLRLPDIKTGDGSSTHLDQTLYHANWTPDPAAEKRDGDIVTSVTLRLGISHTTGAPPYMKLARTYTIMPGSYDVDIVTRVENCTGMATPIAIDQLGSVNLPNDDLNMSRTYVQAGKYMAAGKGKIEGEATYLMDAAVVNESFKKPDGGTAPGFSDIGRMAASPPPGQPADRVVWTAQGNRFFAAIVRPDPMRDPAAPAPATAPATATRLPTEVGSEVYAADWINNVIATPMSTDQKPEDTPVAIYYPGAPVQFAVNQAMEFPFKAYFGPKKADLLAGDNTKPVGTEEYEKAVLHYGKVIKYAQGGPCGFCTFDWIVDPILKLLEWIYIVVRNYGVAIVILTILVRLALHPLTRMGQTSMAVMQKKMAAIAPEIERVKKRYEKDKKTQQMEIMKVYRENNVNPAGGIMGCLPMLLQTPIWIALYAGLATAIALRHAPFIPGWINDLSNPDTIYRIPTSFHVIIFGVKDAGQDYLPINLLPLLMGVLYFMQMRLNLKQMPKAADPQQQSTQKFSQYMILLFPLFLYNGPSGLNVYMVVSTIGNMVDTWVIRKSLRAKGILPAPAATPM